MIINISSSTVGGLGFNPVTRSVSEIAKPESAKTKAADFSSTPTLSTLSRQLADSAVRAEQRDNTLSRRQLADLAGNLNEQLSGDYYYGNKAKHDNEVPDTSDPELLARAKDATDYIHRAVKWDQTAKNPFAGLSYEQLTLIAYDDSGAYTVNERQAASYGANDIHQAWKKKVCDMMMDEYARTGEAQTPKVLAELLSHYRTLPRIEQVQHPEGYEAGLQSKLGPEAFTTNN
jgi:hypothetical protein